MAFSQQVTLLLCVLQLPAVLLSEIVSGNLIPFGSLVENFSCLESVLGFLGWKSSHTWCKMADKTQGEIIKYITWIQFLRPDPNVVIWPCSISNTDVTLFDSVLCDVWTFFSCFWKFAAAELSCCRGSLPCAQKTFKSFEEKSFYWTSSDVFIKQPSSLAMLSLGSGCFTEAVICD